MAKGDFLKDAEVPGAVMDSVFDLQRKKSSRERRHVNDIDVWDDNEFPGADPEPDDEIEENIADEEEEREPAGKGASGGDVSALKELLEELADQQRVLVNNVSSMELNISSIEKIIKSSGQDMNLSDVVEKLRDTLEVSSSASLEQLDRKFAYFNQENIRELFDQIDQKLRVLNERNKVWQAELGRESEKLGKKVVFWSFVFGFCFSGVTSLCFIMFYAALRKVLPFL